jgi:RNA-binding protein
MDKKRVLKLRVDAQKLKPSVHVGKDGLSSKVIEELKKQLAKNKIVKVRVLASFEGNRKDIAMTIARESQSLLVDVRGSTVVLARDQNGQI